MLRNNWKMTFENLSNSGYEVIIRKGSLSDKKKNASENSVF